MHQTHAVIVYPPSRPCLLDVFLLLAGCSLSLYLIQLSPLVVEVSEPVASTQLRDFILFLPAVMRLPEGIILLWPLFFGTQRALGRAQGLTGGEWLWVISWVGVAVLASLDVWHSLGGMPEFLQTRPRQLWYLIFVPAMAALALLLTLGGLLSRRPAPWTHLFSLALIIWPVVPLVGIQMCGRFP
jgi:hypothetical protein